jgi:hypothetical protein
MGDILKILSCSLLLSYPPRPPLFSRPLVRPLFPSLPLYPILHIYIYTCVCVCVCVYIYMSRCMYISIYIYSLVCLLVCVHIYVYMYTWIVVFAY